jgi:hypothetical protein
MKVLFITLFLQGIVQKTKMGDYFSRNRLLALPTFLWKYIRKEIFHSSEIIPFCSQ